MCDINAYYHENGRDELLMESVDKVVPSEGKVSLENIYGYRISVKGRIKEVTMFNHRIIIERFGVIGKDHEALRDTEAIDGNCTGN